MNILQIDKIKQVPWILCNPDFSEILSLGQINNDSKKIQLRFTEISEISFTINNKQNDEYIKYYDLITSDRLIKIPNVGMFIINEVKIDGDGENEQKTVHANSYEFVINRKTMSLIEGTYKFYDPTDSSTIVGIIMDYLPSWSLNEVDSDLWNLYRCFDNTNISLYNFIIENVSKAFGCLFIFDTLNKKISIKIPENLKVLTDIYLSYNNLIKKISITEQEDNMYTALNVSGSGDLSINLVNPMGNTIYNFDYYVNSIDRKTGIGWMSAELKSGINNWKNYYTTQLPIYSDKLLLRKQYYLDLLDLETHLIELNIEKKALESIIDGLNAQNIDATIRNAELRSVLNNIKAKNQEISNKSNQIDNIVLEILNIQDDVQFNKFLNSNLLIELEGFIKETGYIDENFIKTSDMPEDKIQDLALELFQTGMKRLERISKPVYSFEADTLDLSEMKVFEKYRSQLKPFCEITLNCDNGTFAYPLLLGIDIDFNDNSSINLIFSENWRINNAESDLNDLLGKTLQTTASIINNGIKWSEYINRDKEKLDYLFNNPLNADLKEIMNADNQEVIINHIGLMGRKLISDGIYDPHQWKLSNNKLMFTDNEWDTAKMALGQITLPDGSQAYGINSEVLIGKLIIGNQLIIENSSNTFKVDSNGAALINATLSILNDKNRFLLNPADGIKIQKKNGSNWMDSFYVNTDGDVVLKGSITAGSTITGTTIKGGEIYIGGSQTAANCKFGVTSEGKILGLETVNGLFTVDKDGNVAFKNSVLINGNLTLGGNITWLTHDPAIDIAYNKATSAYNLADGVDDELSAVKTNIGYTQIGSNYVISPIIMGSNIYGSKFYGTTSNSSYLQIGVEGGGSRGNLLLMRGDNSVLFAVIDWGTSVDLTIKNGGVIKSILNISTSNDTTKPQGNWDFSDATTTGIVARFA